MTKADDLKEENQQLKQQIQYYQDIENLKNKGVCNYLVIMELKGIRQALEKLGIPSEEGDK